MFKENLSIRIYMNDTLVLAGINHSRENYCIIVGGWKAEDFLDLLLKLYVYDLLK